MSDGNGTKLLNENIDPKTWKGYVVRMLEDIVTKLENVDGRQQKIEDKVDNLEEKMSDCSKCGLKDLMIVVYGDKQNQKVGLIGRMSNLELSHKLKSGWYGALGGGGLAGLMVAFYFILSHFWGK